MQSVADDSDIFAAPTEVASVEECDFYHSVDLPGIGTVEGQWDLRPSVDAYLGHYEFKDKKVLEIGPASGFLTFHIEAAGAREVVAVDLPLEEGYTWDYVPYADLDLEELSEQRTAVLTRVRNSFWLSHRLRASKAKVYYGSAYDLPQQIGRFDTALFASVLLHMQNPLGTLQECAKYVDETIIVTEVFHRDLKKQPVCRLKPSLKKHLSYTWWEFSPDFFSRFLSILGFADQRVTRSKHSYKVTGKMKEMFTIVASRSPRA